MTNRRPTTPRALRAFTLVEVTLALGIAVFCLVVVFGLLTVGLNTSAISVEQTNAVNLLSVVANDLRTAPKPFPQGSATPSPQSSATPVPQGTYYSSPIYELPVPAASPLPSASPASTPAFTGPTVLYLDTDGNYHDASGKLSKTSPTARYQLNVWLQPGVGRGATAARVMLSWPPAADYSNASGSVETLVILDRN